MGTDRKGYGFLWGPQSQARPGEGKVVKRGGDGREEGDTHPALGLAL